MQPPPLAAEKAVLAATSELVRRIEIYEADAITPWSNGDNNDRLIDGNVSLDYGQDVRRSIELTLDNSDFALEHSPAAFWYDKIVKVYCGVKYVDTTPLVSQVVNTNMAPNPSAEVNIADWHAGFIATTITRETSPVDRVNLCNNPMPSGSATGYSPALTPSTAPWDGSRSCVKRVADGVNTFYIFTPTANPVITAGTTFTVSAKVQVPAGKWYRIAAHRRTGNAYLEYGPMIQSDGLATRVGISHTPAADGDMDLALLAYDNAAFSVLAAGTEIALGDVMMTTGVVDVEEYFDGATASTSEFDYLWSGTANASTSIRAFLPPSGSAVIQGVSTINNGMEVMTIPVGMVPGKSYTVIAKARASKEMHIYFGEYFGEIEMTTVGNSWQEYRFTFVCTVAGQKIGFTNGDGYDPQRPMLGDRIWVDNMTILTESNTTTGYFDGSTLDFANRVYAWTGTAHNSTSTETITISTPQALDAEWEAQVGEFMIDSISEDHFPPVIKVTGRDYTKKCLLTKFTNTISFPASDSIEYAIYVMASVAGISKFILPWFSGVALGRVTTFERGTSRWEAMKQIADSFGYDLFFDARGYLTMKEYSDPSLSPVSYTLQTGPEVGNLTSYSKTVNDNRIYNKVLVVGESNDTALIPVSAVAENTLITSPTSIAKLGERLYQYSSPFITTEVQAQDVANKFLKIHGLEEFDLNFGAISLFWLEVGEIIEFIDPRPNDGQPTRFLLSQASLPLNLGPMSGNAKRVSVVS